MKIGAVNSFCTGNTSTTKRNGTPIKPAFKADVRVADMFYPNNKSVDDYQINDMQTLLENAQYDYKSVGNDNLLVVLAPVIRKHPIFKDALDIAVTATYKDPQRAQREILRSKRSFDPTYKDYHANDDYTDFLVTSPHYIPALSKEMGHSDNKVTTKEDLDNYMFNYLGKLDTLSRKEDLTLQQHVRITRDSSIKDPTLEIIG